MTPNLAYVAVRNPYSHGFGLWLPIFLLWIPFFFLAPFILLVLVVACLVLRISPWRAIASVWAVLSALSGTAVDVRAGQNIVQVKLI